MSKNYINIIRTIIITSFYLFVSDFSFASNKNFHIYLQVVDSSESFLWNTSEKNWNYCNFYNYKYDSLGNRIEYLRKYFDLNNNQWLNENKNTISYNENENIYNLLIHKWDTLNNKWDNFSHDTIIFNDTGKEISEILLQWDTLNNKWINQNCRISLYNENKLSSDTIKNWDTVSSKWINNIYNIYIYESNSMNVSSFLWDTTTNNWINNEKKIFLYNDAGQETKLTSQQWDTTNNVWFNNYKYTITYNTENKKTEYLFQINDTSLQAWINCYRDTLIYDTNGNNSVFLSQIWDEKTSSWINKSKSINSFDKRNNITEQMSYKWDIEAEIWDNYSKIEYYWSEIECLLTAEITDSTNILCYGNNTGSATVTASGGIEPFFYQWDDNLNSTSATATNLSANVYYHVVVTDSVKCEVNDSIMLSQPDELLIDFSDVNNVSCFGFNDGNISITATGGIEPYIYHWNNSDSSTTSSISGLAANIFYHISVTDNNGCTTIDSIMLTEPDKIITSEISGPTQVYKNDIATYYVSKTINSVYNWNVSGGEILSGQGSDSVYIEWQSVGKNELFVIETVENGCIGDTVKLIVNVESNSIKDISSINDVIVYPNPFKENTTIYIPKSIKTFNLYIIDIQGRIVKSLQNNSQNQISINAKDLHSGFYYMKIVSNNKILTKKIVCE
ncbi:MAG: hypothetical protein DRJ01_00160 [Bacteroidetes bacterium]|nr:MAG: hypothetical protein DRJ01_00160 [Bacteroidota bacterium]